MSNDDAKKKKSKKKATKKPAAAAKKKAAASPSSEPATDAVASANDGDSGKAAPTKAKAKKKRGAAKKDERDLFSPQPAEPAQQHPSPDASADAEQAAASTDPRQRPPMANPGSLAMNEVAQHLERIAHLIQLESLAGTLAENLASGALEKIKGVGDSIRAKLRELADTGRMEAETELLEQIPPGLDRILDVQGVGPKKVRKLWQELGVESLDDLEKACRADKLAGLAGFGAKTQANILEGIAFLRRVADRVRLDQAWAAAEGVTKGLDALQAAGLIVRYQVAGSLRRSRETTGDVDIVCSCAEADVAAIADAFTEQPGVARVLGKGQTKCSVLLENGVQVDLRLERDDTFAFTLMHFTGSKEHNIVMRQRAIERGMKLNEYGLFRDTSNESLSCTIYQELGLKQWVAPELREDMGEVQAAEAGELPELVEQQDLRGLFHMHTTYSDGRLTLYETAEVGVELGYEYFGITDHSPTAAYAGGLAPERLRQQMEEIDEINREFAGRIVLLKGTESDILADGSLDYDDDLLAELDFVIVSVHSGFLKDAAKMTQRIITAVEHPATTIVGHLTGRLLLQRDGYPVDTDAVLQACARTGTAIEINASPYRLDLDWRWVKRARDLGVKIAINPDAHARDGFGDVRYGIGMARKGWLRKQDVLNTLVLPELQQWLQTQKVRA